MTTTTPTRCVSCNGDISEYEDGSTLCVWCEEQDDLVEHSDDYAMQRLTQPDWCNAPQPGNWRNACMRAPGHDGDHAVRKVYRLDEAWTWPAHGGSRVSYGPADRFHDLWDLRTCGRCGEKHDEPLCADEAAGATAMQMAVLTGS
jgi:hypothetical protein